MGRPKKKGESGAASNYITRTQAVRKLQLSLPDFRKLCIWKGIYPREPRSRKKVSKSSTPSTTFYYAKDIQYLLHEPLIAKFREQKVLEKKISRALGRGDITDAKRHESNASRPDKTGKPRYTLNHVIRERYPTFVDALRDLDDCLSMLFLFANLPSTSAVPAKMIAHCDRLCLEFQHYLIVSHSLRKSFLSIKGVYYQANVQGEEIMWLVPHKFNQRILGDIDFRIMGTFIEFYMALLGFVNFRLYTSIGLKYPPKFDQDKDDSGAELGAFTIEGDTIGDSPTETTDTNSLTGEHHRLGRETASYKIDPKHQEQVNKLMQELKNEEAGKGRDANSEMNKPISEGGSGLELKDADSTDIIDKFEPAVAGGDVLPQPAYSTSNPSSLFAGCTFFLSRETPRQPLEFIIRAFGCKRIGWDAVLGSGAFTTDESDPSITHQIVDRPPVQVEVNPEGDGEDNQTSQKLGPNRKVRGRIYVQPQWVWDSINREELQLPDMYKPGAELPPHLSPFVKTVQGQYDPSLPLDQQQTEAEALATDDDEDDNLEEEKHEAVSKARSGKSVHYGDEDGEDGGMDVAGSEDEGDDSVAEASGHSNSGPLAKKSGEEEVDDEVDDDETVALQRQLELEAELAGRPVQITQMDAKAKAKVDARRALAREAKEREAELERAKGMLPKKKRRLYEQMMYTNNRRSTDDEKLRAKRRKLERKQASTKAGKGEKA